MEFLLTLFTLVRVRCNFLVVRFPLPIPLPDRDGYQGIQDRNHEVETAKQTVANPVAGALGPRGRFGPLRYRGFDWPLTAVLFSPEYDVTLHFSLELRRKYLWTLAISHDSGALYHRMMIAVIDG